MSFVVASKHEFQMYAPSSALWPLVGSNATFSQSLCNSYTELADWKKKKNYTDMGNF